jgi:hypothetical protein
MEERGKEGGRGVECRLVTKEEGRRWWAGREEEDPEEEI